jgi:acyl-CoA hydrolase
MELGTGNITNAVLKHIGACEGMPKFSVHGEVLQDGILGLLTQGRIEFAVGSSLTVIDPWLQKIYEREDFYKERLLLRPSEITNHPEVIQRLNLVALNAALEADICGNLNSTHVMGTSVINGIGGASDFAHNAALSVFMLPSTAKDGKISSMVPFCSHIDLTEHDGDVIVTEQGLADLRGKSPEQRALCIIENCAHPDYKPLLHAYLQRAKSGHIRHDLTAAFAFYDAYEKTGDMRNARL